MKNYTITVNGHVYDVTVEEKVGGAVAPQRVSMPAPVVVPIAAPVAAPVAAPAPVATAAPAPETAPAPAPQPAGTQGSIKITAGAAGKVFKLEASVGQSVKAGEPVLIIEAMKMEIPVVAPQDGTVASIDVAVGDAIDAGAILATLN